MSKFLGDIEVCIMLLFNEVADIFVKTYKNIRREPNKFQCHTFVFFYEEQDKLFTQFLLM